jgi:hypothetical protein
MPFTTATILDQLSQNQSGHALTANQILGALSPAALFGVRQAFGLAVTLYAGNIPVAGTPTPLADQVVMLTDNATNYVYSTAAGVATKTTSIPSGWPGPLAAGAWAIFDCVTANGLIISGHNWRIGIGLTGAAGAAGAQGNPGVDLPGMRLRFRTAVGASSTVVRFFGWDAWSGAAEVARTLASSSFRESIPYVGYETGATAGQSAQVQDPADWCYLGNTTGRGGFTWHIRFCLESANSPATQRSFFGLFQTQTIGNVEPDTLANILGIGAKAGDSNFSIIHNDASGTATMTAFATPGNFPARATDKVYELLLQSVANSQVITGSLTDVENPGNAEIFTFSSNIPSSTQFLRGCMWINNGSTASKAAFGFMQEVGETRY